MHSLILAALSLSLSLSAAARLPAAAVRAPAPLPRAALRMEAAAAKAVAEEEEDRIGAGGRGGHAVPGQPELDAGERELQMRVMKHQRSAARLSMAEDSRSLVAYSTGYGVLSTLSSAVEGYPSGSLVSFGTDPSGLPVFIFSSMSGHTKDLMAAERTCTEGGKAALTVTANGFQGASDGRVTLIGDVKRCDKAEEEELGLRQIYKEKHPSAFWADFGDFSVFRMHNLKAVNFVGGFARAANPKPSEYLEASVDPIQAFAAPVMGHMNADHSDSTVAMCMHYIGFDELDSAEFVQLDRLGFMVQCTRKGDTFKMRLPFPRAAEDRKDVKTLIVQMTQEALGDERVQAWAQARQAAGEPQAA